MKTNNLEKIWQIYPLMPEDFKENNKGFNPFILQLLYNRDIKSSDDLKWFFNDVEIDFLDPFLFRDMEKAVDLIIFHIKKGNKIMIYGDYDADGVTSSALLYDIFKIFKAQVDFYLPDRVSEGYGLNKGAIDDIKKDNFSLIITVDNGIRGKEEVLYAKSLGMDIIVTDHHAYPEEINDLPDCLIINPADKSSGYPFRFLAGVGVAFKLASALIQKSKLADEYKDLLISRSLDLVVIGTIADMVPLIGENRLISQEGLKILNNTKRIGLQELIKVTGAVNELNSFNVGFQLGPRLNAASRIKHANSALNLLISKDKEEAEKLAQDLNDKNIERQKITEEVMSLAESQIDINNLPEIIIVQDFSDNSWNEGVIGLVAGRLTEKYYRPVLVIIKTEEQVNDSDDQLQNVYKGSGRSIEEFNLVEALEDNKEFLYKYGGHPMAGGFSILSEEQVDAFSKNIRKMAQNKLAKTSLLPKLKIDCEISFEDINDELVESIENMSPFGQNNPTPKFVSYNLKIIEISKMGFDGQHIKMKFLNHDDRDMKSFWGISFGGSEKYGNLNVGDNVDVVYNLEFNRFNGRCDTQLKIIDIKIK
ncbi:MAG: single-stranded-DNA-specific exonuclease RecJ [Patescibacteria group bacterium]|nr:single-stranded-DNA-specific exonuclease RecJ [Patescibacteria group bacterium]